MSLDNPILFPSGLTQLPVAYQTGSRMHAVRSITLLLPLDCICCVNTRTMARLGRERQKRSYSDTRVCVQSVDCAASDALSMSLSWLQPMKLQAIESMSKWVWSV